MKELLKLILNSNLLLLTLWWNHNFSHSKGHENLFEKSGSSKNQGVKIQYLTAGREITFGSSYWKVRKIQGFEIRISLYSGNPLIWPAMGHKDLALLTGWLY